MRKTVLFFVLILCSLQVWAYDFTSDGIAYNITDAAKKTVEVTSGGTCKGDIVIPPFVINSSIQYSVTSIGNAAFSLSDITSISIPTSVTYIGNSAFSNSSIKSISIPSSVTSIGTFAFSDCQSLTSVTLPSNLNLINDGMFYCCYQLVSLIIPSSVSSIGEHAFDQCFKLFSVTIPPTVVSIGQHAFAGCRRLSSVAIPSSVTSIGNFAFCGCGFASLIIPSSVVNIGKSAFSGCDSLVSVNISATVASIEEYTFYMCHNLAMVTISSSVKSIGENAFAYCDNLPKINIPNSVTSIGTNAFAFCSALDTVRIPSSLTSIQDDVFRGCYNLISVVIPSSVTSLGSSTFAACRSLASIYEYNSTPSSIFLGYYNSFDYVPTSTCVLYVPTGAKTYYEKAYRWSEFKNIVEMAGVYGVYVSSSSPLGGKVQSNGTYIAGSNCTVTAIPALGYSFANWTENGHIVSTSSSYTFAVNDTHTLVANFVCTISVSKNPPTGGQVNGGGACVSSTVCKLTAIPAAGFIFTNWTDNGTVVSTSTSYSFTVSANCTLIANFKPNNNNSQVKETNCTCRDTNDGKIDIATAVPLYYFVTVIGTKYYKTSTFIGTSYSLAGLVPDTYQIVLGVNGLTDYQQNFTVVITQPEDLSVLKVSAAPNSAQYSVSGGSGYYVVVNDQTTENNDGNVNISLQPGENRIKIYTDKLCQGVYEETIYNDVNGQLSLFPNPTKGKITIGIPGEDKNVTVDLFSLNGQLLRQYHYQIPQSKLVDMDISDFANGTYIVRVNGSVVHKSLRVVKQ
jgi:hypothetical protein